MKNVPDTTVNPKCAANHYAPWLVDPVWMAAQVRAYKAGLLPMAGKVLTENTPDGPVLLYAVDDNGIGYMAINGPMMKGESKFGGTSTLRSRRAIRAARLDSDVKGMMLEIDSPGGTVAGTDELSQDLRLFAKTKPLHVHAEGAIASAAMWIGVQADRLTASRMTDVGSIGVIYYLEDSSGQYEKDGIVGHVITNDEATLKATGMDGQPVTEEQIAYIRELANTTFAQFKATMMSRRRMSETAFGKVSSGRVWLAPQAMELGLIDAVETRDKALSALHGVIVANDRAAKDRARRMANL